MAKYSDYVFDLGKFSGTKTELRAVVRECSAGRPPPLTPKDFELMLEDKSFTTSKKADVGTVARLYQDTFRLRMGQATVLYYASLQWGDAGLALACKVLASGALAQCQELDLSMNQIGDAGIAALAEAIKPVSEGGSGALAQCQELELSLNQIGDAGLTALADACARGALPACTAIGVFGNPASKEAQQAVNDAIKNRQ